MQQLLLDESGKWRYPKKDKSRQPEITFERIERDQLPSSLLSKEAKVPHTVISFIIQVTEQDSLVGNIYMDFDKLSKEEAKDFCKEVIKVWKTKAVPQGSMLSIAHIEKICAKTFKKVHFRLFHLKKSSSFIGLSSHTVCYLDFVPSRICEAFGKRTYYNPVLCTHAIPVPFSTSKKKPSSFFD